MAEYRGVHARHIAQSLKAASDFLQELEIGPQCNWLAESFARPERLEAIELAADDQALRKAIKESYAEPHLAQLKGALYAHGHENTLNKGYFVLKNLMAWGATERDKPLDFTSADREIVTHLGEHGISAFRHTPPANLQSPFVDYQLQYPTPETMREADIQPFYEKVIKPSLEEALKPFAAQGEVSRITLPEIATEIGIQFRATRSAAEAMAETFAEYDVVEAKNQRLVKSEAQRAENKHSHVETLERQIIRDAKVNDRYL